MSDQPTTIFAVTGYIGKGRMRGEWSTRREDCNRPCAEYVLKSASDAEALAEALRFADETFRDLGWHAKWEVTTAALEKWEAGK